MRITTTVSSPVARSFRVDQCAGLFDVQLAERSSETFDVEIPDPAGPWKIGAIIGPSGSGKSTVSRALIEQVPGATLIDHFDWPAADAILDGFPAELDTDLITATLGAVGFASPPAWVRPYRVLSGGQKFRSDLARAILLDAPLVLFDEFTSVVDRRVAKVGSACVHKAIHKGKARCARFVAVSCHYDILPWLRPDWHLDMADGRLHVAQEAAKGKAKARGNSPGDHPSSSASTASAATPPAGFGRLLLATTI